MNSERVEVFPNIQLSAAGLRLPSGVEAYILQTVIQSAEVNGWTVFDTRLRRTVCPVTYDLVLCLLPAFQRFFYKNLR